MESENRFRFSFICKIVALVICCQRCFGGDCPADRRTWVPFEKSCYHFVHGEEDVVKNYTIDRAKGICHGYGLLTINSAQENHFVVEYSTKVWKSRPNIWLDIYYNPDNDTLMWKTETPLVFTNWGQSSNDLMEMDTCAAMNSGTGQWEKVSCEQATENGVVCKAQEEAEKVNKRGNSRVLSALVILSVVVVLGISAVVWFLQQKHNFAPSLFTSFEYHPPFRSPGADETCLVEAEETEGMP